MRLDGSGQPFDEEQRRSELFDLYHVPDSVVVSDGVAAAVDVAPAKRIDAAPAKRLIDLFPEASDSAEDSERLLGRVLGGLKRRLSRRKDAETLLRLEALLEDKKELRRLSREVTLSSSAMDFWAELSQSLRRSSGVQESTAREEEEEEEENEEPFGRSFEEAAKRLDRVWRRDALRALEALEKAPAQLEAEVRRQRLAGLQAELATLGLQSRRPAAITQAELRRARVARAREIHPDLRRGREAAGAGRRGLFGRGRGARKGAGEGRAQGSSLAEGGEQGREREDQDRMSALNAAYERVRRALKAPVYDWRT